MQQLLLRNKRKLLNGRFNKTDYYSSGKKVGEGEMEHYSKSRRREFTALYIYARVESLRIHLKPKEATFYILEVSQEATGEPMV